MFGVVFLLPLDAGRMTHSRVLSKIIVSPEKEANIRWKRNVSEKKTGYILESGFKALFWLLYRQSFGQPVQKFSSPPVVLLSFVSRFALIR